MGRRGRAFRVRDLGLASGMTCLLAGLFYPGSPPPVFPPGFSSSLHRRLIEWLLHRLEMALPQPVLHGKAAEQVSGSQAEEVPAWVVVEGGVLEAQIRVGGLTRVPGDGDTARREPSVATQP